MNSSIVWRPSAPEKTRMADFMRFVERSMDYHVLYQWSIDDPASFWAQIARFFQVSFQTQPIQIRQSAQEMMDVRWFVGARFNFAEQLLRHAMIEPEKSALIAYNEQNIRQEVSFAELKRRVINYAVKMQALGIRPGDRVVGVLANTIDAVIAMLATTAIGAIWSACSPEFGLQTLLDRLLEIKPSVLFICDAYTYQNKVFSMAEKKKGLEAALPSLQHIIACPLPTEDIEDVFFQFEAFPFDHPVYILFSSGTTGQPKCIVHGAGGTVLQHLKELGLHTDLSEKDRLFFYTTCGWMMWNWMVSALSLGTTLILYDGSPHYPSADRMFQLAERERVSVLGTSAKYLASIEQLSIQVKAQYSLPALRTILSTGSPLLPTQYDYVAEAIGAHVQLSSISGGTDIISCFALGNPLLPVYRGALQSIGLGLKVEVYNESGVSIQQGCGELVCTDAFPSMPLYFWNDPDRSRYRQAYFSIFSGVWTHGDFAEKTAQGGLMIHGRSDATLNPGGVRMGTVEIYRPLAMIFELQDYLAIGQAWEGDTRIILFVVMKPGFVLDEALKLRIKTVLRQAASPRHVPAKIIQVPDLPRTMNGKIVELAVRQVVHGLPVLQQGSLANPESLQYFKALELQE